jgi:hypothetical protein
MSPSLNTDTSWPLLTTVSLTMSAPTSCPTRRSVWDMREKTVPPFTVRCSLSSLPVRLLTRPTAVVGGDTCDAVAAAHSVNTTLLHENNPQINPECTNIYIGEVLCVASTVIVPPPANGKSFPIPSTAIPANPTQTPEPSTDDDDEEDLPWCDEI